MPEATSSLEAELRALAADLDTGTPGPDLAVLVLDRITAEPLPVPAGRVRRARSWLRTRWQAVLAALVALIAGLSLAPPVRATVAEWFGFHGVVVSQQPGPAPTTTAPPPPPAGRTVTLAQARQLVGFVPRLPSALGPPTGIEVSADRNVLSLSWTVGGRTVRIDEFSGEVEPRFWKSVRGEVEFADVAGAPAIWFGTPHTLGVLRPDGTFHYEPPRIAGPTLVWQSRGLTFRLEGLQARAEAMRIAGSVP
jgi:hypothetical protein